MADCQAVLFQLAGNMVQCSSLFPAAGGIQRQGVFHGSFSGFIFLDWKYTLPVQSDFMPKYETEQVGIFGVNHMVSDNQY